MACGINKNGFLEEQNFVYSMVHPYSSINTIFFKGLRPAAGQGPIHVCYSLQNIHLLTPAESATGYTVAKAHVLALQQCREGELVPDGQQVELARSFVAFT